MMITVYYNILFFTTFQAAISVRKCQQALFCTRYFATSAMICYDCGALHNHHLPVGFGVSHQALGM
jgi:hypothetical protein